MSTPTVLPVSRSCVVLEGADAVVCHCQQVRESEVRELIDSGAARNVGELSRRTGVGSNCRGCHCRLERMLAGLPAHCGRFAPCGGCGCILALCRCEAA